MVQVLNIDSKPLMPCPEAKARHLLEKHKAEIVKYNPFTIRLKFVCSNITQPITKKETKRGRKNVRRY